MTGDPEITARNRQTALKLQVARRNSLLALAAIAAASLVILAWAASGKPSSNTLRYELAKTAMQVIAVACLGSLAAMATFVFQHSRTRAAEDRDQMLKEEQHRIDSDRDKRDRQNDLLRSLLRDTLTTYNRVKRTRRLLTAEITDAKQGRVRLDGYDRHMVDLIDEQLQFEQFKRLAPFLNDTRLSVPPPPQSTAADAPKSQSLKDLYETIEKYLNRVIQEYQENRYLVARVPEGLSAPTFTKLSGFVNGPFKTEVAAQIDLIIELLLKAVLEPLAPPQADEGEQAVEPNVAVESEVG